MADQLRLALFGTAAVADSLSQCIVPRLAARLDVLPDPSRNSRPWFDHHFDAMLINPFDCAIAPEAAMALARGIAGQRPLFGLAPADCAQQRAMMIAHGADDAMFVGGDCAEMAVRIAALLRRHAVARALLACDELRIDLVERHVSRDGQAIRMPLREFAMLSALARTPDHVVPRSTLWRSVWRLDFDPGTNRIEVHMSRLRARVDAGFAFPMLRTVKGVGYALVSRAGALAFAQARRAG